MREVRSALLAGPQHYQQRTRITGADLLNVSEDAARSIGPGSAGDVSGSQPEDLNGVVQETGESVFYMALGADERARLLEPSNMSERPGHARERVRTRTLTDILEGGAGKKGLHEGEPEAPRMSNRWKAERTDIHRNGQG
jgi:hypothetical protein